MAEDARVARHAVPRPVVGEKLALEPRHVDADRAFGLARPALQAEVEHLVRTPDHRDRPRQVARHGKPQDVGPAARGVLPRRCVAM